MPLPPTGNQTPVVKRRWKPSPAIQLSALLHVGAAVTVAARPHIWPWALGAVVADHLMLTAAGLWPRSRLLGPNWTRLPDSAANGAAVAITIDDGPDPQITPRVLDMLEVYGARATFFCIGERVSQYAQLTREIVGRGHSIENHSQRHLNRFSVLGPRSMLREVARAQESIAAVTGQAPAFFRAPAGLRSPFLDPVLSRLDLRLASWTRRGFDTVNHNSATVLQRLTRGLRAGDILLLHDGHAARAESGAPVILEVLPKLLQAVTAARLKPITLRAALS